MIRAVAIILMIFSLVVPAQANNPLEELNRALDGLNRMLKGKPPTDSTSKEAIQSDKKVTIHHGVCATYNRNLEQIFRERCRAKATCNSAGDCEIRYLIGKMYLAAEFANGRLTRFWDQEASWVTVDAHDCMMGRASGISLCFIEDDALTGGGQETAEQNSNVDKADQRAAEARTRRKAEAIELSRRLREEREAKEARARQRAEEEEQARKRAEAEAARNRAEAELEKQKALMTELILPSEVERFFKDKSLATLAPIDAKGACRDHFLPQVAAVASPVPTDMLDLLGNYCGASALNYGRRQAANEGERLANIILDQPASLAGLIRNDWFLFDEKKLNAIPAHLDGFARQKYYSLYGDHRKAAIANAITEIRNAFKSAVPMTASSEDAWKLCDLPSKAPVEISDLCKAEREKLKRRIVKARCDQAIEQSGASESFLNRMIASSGSRYEKWTVRRMICAGVGNHPNYRIAIEQAWFPTLTWSTLRIFDEKKSVILEVALRVSTPRDGRSFRKLLLDIATGENERPVEETLVVQTIRHVASGIRFHKQDAVIGCVLSFIRCG